MTTYKQKNSIHSATDRLNIHAEQSYRNEKKIKRKIKNR